MEGEGSRVFRSSDGARENKDRGREGERYIGLANVKVHQGYTEVLGIGKLLSLIYQRLCIHSQTSAQHGEKESEVGMDRKTERGV